MMQPGRGGALKTLTYDKQATEASLARLTAADLSFSKISNAFIVQTDPNDTVLRNVKLKRADLSHSNLTGAMFDFGSLANAYTSGAKVARGLESLDAGLGQILAAHLTWIDSAGKVGQRADFSTVGLTGHDLSDTNLAAAELEGAILKGATLSGCVLTMARLPFADLREARLVGADLRGANLMRATLSHADLSHCRGGPVHVLGANGHLCAHQPRTRPSGRRHHHRRQFPPDQAVKSNFGQSKLNDLDLSGADLRDAD